MLVGQSTGLKSPAARGLRLTVVSHSGASSHLPPHGNNNNTNNPSHNGGVRANGAFERPAPSGNHQSSQVYYTCRRHQNRHLTRL